MFLDRLVAKVTGASRASNQQLAIYDFYSNAILVHKKIIMYSYAPRRMILHQPLLGGNNKWFGVFDGGDKNKAKPLNHSYLITLN